MTDRKLTAKEKAERQRSHTYWAQGLPLASARLELAGFETVNAQSLVRDALADIGQALKTILPHFTMPNAIPLDPMMLTGAPRFADHVLDRWAMWGHFDPASNALIERLYLGSLCAFGYEHPRRVDAAPALIPSQLFTVANVTMDECTVRGEGYSFFDVRVVNRPVEAILFPPERLEAKRPAGARQLFMALFRDLANRSELPVEVTAGAGMRLKSLCLQRYPFYEDDIRRISAKTLGGYLTAFRREDAVQAIVCESALQKSQ